MFVGSKKECVVDGGEVPSEKVTSVEMGTTDDNNSTGEIHLFVPLLHYDKEARGVDVLGSKWMIFWMKC